MAISLEETTLFSTPIYAAVIDDIDNKTAMNEAYSIFAYDNEGREVSNDGGWQSKDIAAALNDLPEISKIVDYATMAATEIFLKWRINDSGAIVSGVWCNINGDGDYNRSHSHPMTTMSACYYVASEQGSGAIVFERPDPQEYFFPPVGDESPYTARSIGVNPYSGLLLVFPSYLKHYVLPNNSGSDRISIAMNFM